MFYFSPLKFASFTEAPMSTELKCENKIRDYIL